MPKWIVLVFCVLANCGTPETATETGFPACVDCRSVCLESYPFAFEHIGIVLATVVQEGANNTNDVLEVREVLESGESVRLGYQFELGTGAHSLSERFVVWLARAPIGGWFAQYSLPVVDGDVICPSGCLDQNDLPPPSDPLAHPAFVLALPDYVDAVGAPNCEETLARHLRE